MQNVSILALSILLALLFFVWGVTGNPLQLFSWSFPRLHFFICTCLLSLFILRKEHFKIQSIKILDNSRYLFLPLAGFLIAVSINVFVFESVPHVQDEIHYKYMAETYATGAIFQEMPFHYEFFNYVFFLVDGERHFSLFMPGFPLFLVPFAFLGVTFLANPILTAVNVFLVGRLADYLFGKATSTASMSLFLLSPFMMTMGGTWMPHPFTAMLTLVVVFTFLKSRVSDRSFFPFVSGFALGWLLLSRPQNACILVLTLFLFYLLDTKQHWGIGKVTWFLAPLSCAVLLLAAYNTFFTGDPLTFVQDLYFDMTEPVNGCHSIGLKKGCQHCNGELLPVGGMTWQYGVEVTRQRLRPLVAETFPHPLMFVFLIVSLMLTAGSRRENQKKIFLVMLFLAPVLGYFLFYFNGNVYGPRYLYEGTTFLVILVASGIVGLFDRFIERKATISVFVLIAFLVGSVVYQLRFATLDGLRFYQRDFWGVGSILKAKAKESGISNSVIFVATRHAEGYGSGLVAMNLGRFEESSNIFVRDLGEASNSKYMHYMSGRSYYKTQYVPGMEDLSFTGIEPRYRVGFIHVEFEDKFLPYSLPSSQPDYCNTYPVRDDIYRYLEFSKMPEILFSRRQSLYCRFTEEEQAYSFGQYFQEDGTYDSTMVAVSGPVFGDFDVFFGGRIVGSFESLDREKNTLKTVRFRVIVSEGLHTFRIVPRVGSLAKRNYVMLDFIQFKLVEEGR